MTGEIALSEPQQMAARLAEVLGVGSLLAFDVDGVLAPIVPHANDAALSPGVLESLAALAKHTEVAVVSGRSLDSLERLFGFPPSIHVVGSHGLETRGVPTPPLSEDEQATFDRLEQLSREAVTAMGDGGWIEYKPTSVVVHNRAVDPAAASAPMAALERAACEVPGSSIKHGSHVLELMARAMDKGTALLALARAVGRDVGSFVGDDVTDEDAFKAVPTSAVTIKVGPGLTAARYRLADPAAVAATLALLAQRPG